MCCDALSLPSHHPLLPPLCRSLVLTIATGGHVTDDWAGECNTHTPVSSSPRQCWRQPTTSEVYHARDSTTSPAEGCVCCCPTPCASLCVLLCCVPRLSTLQHYCIPKDGPYSPTRTTSNSLQPWTAPRPLDCTQC